MPRIALLHDLAENETTMGQDDVRTLRQQMDRILFLLEGEEDVPGLVHRVSTLEELLLGRKGSDGMAHQVRTLLKFKTWFLCTLSAVAGYAVQPMIAKFFH